MILRELRLARSLTQREMADRIGCSKVVYSRYERGERQPDIRTLCHIADILQVTLDELVGREMKIPSDVVKRE